MKFSIQTISAICVVLLSTSSSCSAFTITTQSDLLHSNPWKVKQQNTKRISELSMTASPLSKLKIPNPFSSNADEEQELLTPRPPSTLPFMGTLEQLVAKAKEVLASDLAVRDESLLGDDFIWIGPNSGGRVLGKQDYLAAGQFFDLRSTFPDLDYRVHDFRLDAKDPYTVRVTLRTVGTMRGELRLRTETLSPNGKRMVCPPGTLLIALASPRVNCDSIPFYIR